LKAFCLNEVLKTWGGFPLRKVRRKQFQVEENYKNKSLARHQWLTLVIPATWED
jgi:hypothetical protein